MARKKIRLRKYDRLMMELLMIYPAMSAEQINDLMALLYGYKRQLNNLTSRLYDLCGAKKDDPPEKYKNRKIPRNGYLLTSNVYYGVKYAAEDIEDRFDTGVEMYSITKDGRKMMGVNQDPPARKNKHLWVYHYQISLLIKLLSAGIPLDVMSPAVDYKRLRKISNYTPMWFIFNLPSRKICLTFLKPIRKKEPVVGPGWSGIVPFVKKTSKHGRSEDYVLLVSKKYYKEVADRLLSSSAYRTFLITYEESVEILRNQIANQDYYVELLASYLGVEKFRVTNGIGSGVYRGQPVVLYETISGLIRAYRELYSRHKGDIRDGAIVYCLIPEWQKSIKDKRLLPDFPGCKYVTYEQVYESCYA